MIPVIIIDDEPNARETIKNILKYSPVKVDIIGEASDVKSAHELLCNTSPELVFLDINLPDGTGFDLLKLHENPSFKTIFITAHEEHAIKAFKYSAIDYILKPINSADLFKAVEKAKETIGNDQMSMKLNTLISNLDKLKKLVLKTAESIHIINVSEIVRCEADVNYTHFYLEGGKHLMVSKPLKDYDELLSDSGFFRTHQSHLVHLEHITRYEKTDGGYLVMDDGSNVPVSTRKKDEMLKVFNRIF